jgi:3'-phosphoadenosine 5'-phosphosulfate sulfotransferase (PAPS reductase)/FAD synthetase
MRDTERRGYLAHSRTAAYSKKIDDAKRSIDKAYKVGPAIVSTSFGKDSGALVHICHSVIGELKMFHMACAHELPGGDGVRKFCEGLGEITELPPLNTIKESIEWLKSVGLPHERGKAEHQRIIQTRKKDRGRDWCLENGYSVQVLGMRAEESRGRRWCFRVRGDTYELSTGITVCNPLAWWSVKDVWAYHVVNDIPWHPLYDMQVLGFTREMLRNGGWLYTDGAGNGWVAWLRRCYPEQYERLTLEFPGISSVS